jgi:DNA-directed RNA polymerase specialized sigma24 family protein
MVDATCWTLIEGAAAGNNEARAQFAGRYLPVVRAYLRARWTNRLSAHDLDDAAQEVFVECLREGGVLERASTGPREGFRAFLFGVVRHVALRHEKARAMRVDAPCTEAFDAEALPVHEESLSRVFDKAWAAAILREAAEQQAMFARDRGPESVRRVELLRLVFREGRSIAEVARLWGVESGFLHHECDRARAEFLRALKEVVAFHHPHFPEAVVRECRELVGLFG